MVFGFGLVFVVVFMVVGGGGVFFNAMGVKVSQNNVTTKFSARHQQEPHQWYMDCHAALREMVVAHGSSEGPTNKQQPGTFC